MCGCLSCAPYWGAWPTIQTCALTGNRTGRPLVRRLVLNPLSHTSKAFFFFFKLSCKFFKRVNLTVYTLC